MAESSLGEFEQVVLLAILRQRESAFALEVRRDLEAESGRSISRGAFYTTLERLKRKGLVRWTQVQPAHARRRGIQRLFSVTPRGMEVLRSTRQRLKERWMRLDEALEEA